MHREEKILSAGMRLREAVDRLSFSPPVTHLYNPLVYAWAPYADYVERYGTSRKKIVFLGMNPGPWGMAQTGVPFGEVAMVREWIGVNGPVGKPLLEHPKRPIEGFHCKRSEVSGRRLWGLFAAEFGKAENFFSDHFVANYCPLAFMEESGRNRTPDKLPAKERRPLFEACDRHLFEVVEALQPEWLIGVGAFAEKRAMETFPETTLKIGRVLHPSPASPAANRDWAGAVRSQLRALGAWCRELA